MVDFPRLSDDADVTVLAQAVRDYVSGRSCSGRGNTVSVAAGATVIVPVDYPLTFASLPTVQATIRAANPQVFSVSVTDESTNGCSLVIRNNSGSPTPAYYGWTALAVV